MGNLQMLQLTSQTRTPIRDSPLTQSISQRRRRAGTVQASEGDDLIGKAFQALFGRRAREDRQPLGLKRLEGTALQAQYEANTKDRAKPVSTDDGDMRLVRPMLAGTVLESATLR